MVQLETQSTEDECQEFDRREEPDGEETINKNTQSLTQQQPSTGSASASATTNCNAVKVPNWILNDTTMEVVFNERATAQLHEFQINRVSFPLSLLETEESDNVFVFLFAGKYR